MTRNDLLAKNISDSLEKYLKDDKFCEFVIKTASGPFHFSLDLLARPPKNGGKGSASLD